MKVLRTLLSYLIPLLLFCGVVDYFTYIPMDGPTKWGTIFAGCLMVSVLAMLWGFRRPVQDLEDMYRVERRVSQPERDARR